jgi:hypothetical protein
VTEQEILQTLTPDTRDAVKQLIAFARARGLTPKLLEGQRSCARQAALYAQGRTTDGPQVTWVQGCRSWHIFGRAVDLHIGSENCADYEPLGKFWESLGGGWGGRFAQKDCVHFEWAHPDLPLSELCPDPGACDAAVRGAPRPRIPVWPALAGLALGIVMGRAIVELTRK